MLKRFASVALAAALVCTIGGTSVLAATQTKTDPQAKGVETPPDRKTSTELPASPAREEAQPNEKLKAGVARLLADTKAGKRKLSAAAQIQPARGNNLSKRTKIALVVGIAVVVVVVIVAIHIHNHFFDDFHPFRN